MLSRAVDPQVQARRALSKVYALLYRLADEKEDQKAADCGNPGEETQSTAGQDNPKRLSSNEQFYPTASN